ncbi:hypothetical protein [Bradyrhizobium sp.]|uniref:hypothetical protein n=1 Tax=Bradyrhizobium sp. TaxID=376 RepID=UPI002733098E|nr:hypothetical protein [Bradyrhizobium sp.]MDP3074904.1 hypothetical protein [Bradyrhizobium sp.]
MDTSKPPIFPSEFRLPSASERTPADIDIAPPGLTKSDELAAVEPQSHPGPVPRDRPSIAVYFRNEEEVSEGFFIALNAMGVAVIDPLPEPPMHPISGAKP